MITPLLSLLLAVKLVSHSGQVSPPGYATIQVSDCKEQSATMFGDPKGLIPVSNNISADRFGNYSFFTESPFIILRIYYDSEQPPIVIRTCPEPEKTHK